MQRLHALFLLALALVRSLLVRAFGGHRGLADFKASYAPDRLPPVSPDERRALGSMSGCIACGLCNLGEGMAAAASQGAYAGPMDVITNGSRSMPDYDAAALSLAHVPEARLAELEARCPTRVPMRRIAAFIRDKAREASEMGGSS